VFFHQSIVSLCDPDRTGTDQIGRRPYLPGGRGQSPGEETRGSSDSSDGLNLLLETQRRKKSFEEKENIVPGMES
jgi:hypothetical protein